MFKMKRVTGTLGAIAMATGLAGPVAAQDDTFKIGVITFLSGQAAESFGVPAWNGGKVLVDMLNEGCLLYTSDAADE